MATVILVVLMICHVDVEDVSSNMTMHFTAARVWPWWSTSIVAWRSGMPWRRQVLRALNIFSITWVCMRSSWMTSWRIRSACMSMTMIAEVGNLLLKRSHLVSQIGHGALRLLLKSLSMSLLLTELLKCIIMPCLKSCEVGARFLSMHPQIVPCDVLSIILEMIRRRPISITPSHHYQSKWCMLIEGVRVPNYCFTHLERGQVGWTVQVRATRTRRKWERNGGLTQLNTHKRLYGGRLEKWRSRTQNKR